MSEKSDIIASIIDALTDPVLFVNTRRDISFANTAAYKLFNGYPPAAATPEMRKLLSGGLESGLRNTAVIMGKEYTVTVAALETAGESLGAIVVLREMTDIRSLEAELKEARNSCRELDMIIKSSYDGIFVIDGSGIAIKYNESYCRITGLDAAEMMGLHMREIVKRKYFSETVGLKVLETRSVATTMPTLSSGKKVLITGSPVFDENGELIRIVANVRDITELISLKSQMEEAKELAERYYSEILHLRGQQSEVDGFIFESPKMKSILSTAVKVAHTNATVLITGDSGVGKEVLARIIHNNSEYKDGPFVKINCGAIPETLLESELFGYEKGAFTSAASTGKPGLFEVATQGTVFLDEIGEIPLALQAKLLGVLQDMKFTKVGGVKPIEMKSRVITATNRDLADMIGKGQFRKDLFYRLNVVPLPVPPLSDRRSDIFPLARHFLTKFNAKYNTNKTLSTQVIAAFEEYDWPGNVREMENLLEQLVVLAPTGQLTLDMLPEEKFAPRAKNHFSEGKRLGEILNDVERNLFRRLLDKGYSTYKIARELGISQPTVVRKINRLGLN
ncbi:sigma 54-interacting transcriptional regulator [Anaeroselena agilis]|uniref:HTH-type transcriptional regulatory protein TyrR n=1 Tax=Anaeroselena agilis TaxID=3063788 RepID=A0ABU3NWB6_9FIRM|nr:sigma 54-interacting transcriptional regulator [Selenomonadales bacterium 4137-cl]